MLFKNNFILSLMFFIVSTTFVSAQTVYTCVWRNPEATMTKLFPDAKDYRTINAKLTPEIIAKVEAVTGSPVLPGQRDNFQYFEMTNANKEVIGYTLAATQKGEFGAIEFVFGIDNDSKIVNIYIQRSREKDRLFWDPKFLGFFTGKSSTEIPKLTDPLKEKGSTGTKAVLLGVKKDFLMFDNVRKKN